MRKDGPAQPDHAQVAFHPPLLLLVCIVSGFLLRWASPMPFLPDPVSSWAGPALTALALGLFFWAVVTMKRGGASIPTGEPTAALVARGPYRFTRNPIYLAMVLLQLGIGTWADSIWFFLLAALSAFALWLGVISREELYLERKFGDEYLAYKARVGRWL